MPNPSGQLVWFSGRPYIRVSLGNNKRPHIALACLEKEDAEKRVTFISNMIVQLRRTGNDKLVEELTHRAAAARNANEVEGLRRAVQAICEGNVAPRPKFEDGITFRRFAEMWTSGELHEMYPKRVKRKKTSSFDDQILRKYVYPEIGDLPLVAVTGDHAEDVLNKVPDDLSEHLARHVAQVMNRVMRLAVFPAKLIPASPIPAGFLPKIESARARTYLFPEEDRKLLGCTDIYLVFRLLYGFLAREGLRVSEALTLDFADLDLVHGAINLDRNKTDDPRWWALDPGVVEALRIWKKYFHGNAVPSSRVFIYPSESRQAGKPVTAALRAEEFREHLERAGCTRPQLYARSKHRRPICIHDLRATFITIALANGKPETFISDRTGHKSSKMINEYRRKARSQEELRLGQLASLVECIPEFALLHANLQAQRPANPPAHTASAMPAT